MTLDHSRLVYVIGLHALQFGNKWMKKIRGQPKVDEAVGRVQFICQRNFFEFNYSQIGQACSPLTY